MTLESILLIGPFVGLPVVLIAVHLVDPEMIELYLGDRALLAATAVAAVVSFALLVDLTMPSREGSTPREIVPLSRCAAASR